MSSLWTLIVLLAAGSPEPPPDRPVDREIAFWLARLTRDPEDPITPTKLGAAYFQKARESGDLSYNAKAEAMCREALKRNPEHAPARAGLASACIAQHKFHEALHQADLLVQNFPGELFPYALQMDAWLELGEVPRAAATAEKLVRSEPGFFSYSRLANVKYVTGDIPAALDNYSNAIEGAGNESGPPENLAWSHVQQGGLFFATGHFKEAEDHYQAALKIQPGYFSALEHLAELRAAQTNYSEAVRLYQLVIQTIPRPEYEQALGDVFIAFGKAAEGRLWHERALDGYLASVKSGQVHYYHHLAGFYSDARENPAEALKWAKKDLELRPNIFAQDALAWALYKNGEWKEAAEVMKKVFVFGTRDAHLFFHAGLIALAAENPAEGKKYLKEAAAVNPFFTRFHAHR